MFYFTLLVAIGLSTAAICPKQKQTDVPKFTKKLGNEDMVRLHNSIAILCCSEGYRNITWYRLEGSDWISWPPGGSGSSAAPTTEENNQVLRINRAVMADNTSFRCDLHKDGQVVKQHIMQLIVVRCADMARGPIPTDPFTQNATISNFGENVTFSCTGFFGCNNDLRIATWFVKNESNLPVTSERYVKTDYHGNYDSTIIGSDLTVYDVQPVDLKRTFICELASSQIFQGTYKTSAKIFKKEPPVKVPLRKWIAVTAGSVVGLVGLMIIVVAGINKCYGPRVIWYLKNHLPNFQPLPERGNMEYNALLFHADDDTRKAHEVREKLQQKGFEIFLSDDIGGNKFLGVYEEKLKKSLKIVFLYSDNLKDDNFAHFLLQSLIISGRDKDIIFLVLDEFLPKNIKDSTDAARKPNQENEITDNDTLLENNDPPIHNGEANVNDLEQDGENDDVNCYKRKELSFWKSLPHWNVPNEDASERQNKNFICWLQKEIPKFDDQVKEEKIQKRSKTNRKRRTSSGRSLLRSQTDDGLMPPNSPRDTVFDEQCNNNDTVQRQELDQANIIVTSIEDIDETHVKHAIPKITDTNHGKGNSFYYGLNPENRQYLEQKQNIEGVSVCSTVGVFDSADETLVKCIDTGDNTDNIETTDYEGNVRLKDEGFTASGSSGASELMSSLSGSFEQNQNNIQSQVLDKQHEEKQNSALVNRSKLGPITMPDRFSSGESGYGESPEKSLSPGINEVFSGKH